MLENLNDYISLFTMILIILSCIYIIFSISNSKHAKKMKQREELYLSFLENADDDYNDSSNEEEEV